MNFHNTWQICADSQRSLDFGTCSNCSDKRVRRKFMPPLLHYIWTPAICVTKYDTKCSK